jgi:hypothetical protein
MGFPTAFVWLRLLTTPAISFLTFAGEVHQGFAPRPTISFIADSSIADIIGLSSVGATN